MCVHAGSCVCVCVCAGCHQIHSVNAEQQRSEHLALRLQSERSSGLNALTSTLKNTFKIICLCTIAFKSLWKTIHKSIKRINPRPRKPNRLCFHFFFFTFNNLWRRLLNKISDSSWKSSRLQHVNKLLKCFVCPCRPAPCSPCSRIYFIYQTTREAGAAGRPAYRTNPSILINRGGQRG